MDSLTLPTLKCAAKTFLKRISSTPIPTLYGVTDGKAVGTHVEHSFQEYLSSLFTYMRGSSASGIDFPELEVDLKVTSVRQPQSSCPFRDADQKVYGLGYDLMIFVYDKTDDVEKQAARLKFLHAMFVERSKTGDYQTTFGILEILRRKGNQDDLIAFFEERNLPLDEIGRAKLADRVLQAPPEQGYLTISNALQWRLQYGRIITIADSGNVQGVENLLA
jgi:restriction system protein